MRAERDARNLAGFHDPPTTRPPRPLSFELEVSSPGLDRRLRTVSDFEREVGSNISLRFLNRVEGLGKQTAGQLLKVEGRLHGALRFLACPDR